MNIFTRFHSSCKLDQQVEIINMTVSELPLPTGFDEGVHQSIKHYLPNYYKIEATAKITTYLKIFDYEYKKTKKYTAYTKSLNDTPPTTNIVKAGIEQSLWSPKSDFDRIVSLAISGEVEDLIKFKQTTAETTISKYDYTSLDFGNTKDLMEFIDYLISLGKEHYQFTAAMIDWSPMFYAAAELDEVREHIETITQ